MSVELCLTAVVCLICNLVGAIPSYIQPCSASDPNINHCIEKSIKIAGPKFADGIPELGVAPLDPAELGTIYVDNPALNLVFTNTSVIGLRNFKVNSFKVNLEKGKAIFDFTSNVTLKAYYNMDGQILILPIRGNGQAKIKITNLNIVITYNFETKNGHWVVTNYTDTYKMDRAVFKFTNLFGGNKQLADVTTWFVNENWSIIMQEIAPPAIEQVIHKCVDQVEILFETTPISELITA